MRERPAPRLRQLAGREAPFTVDVVAFSLRGDALGVLCPSMSVRGRGRRALPYGVPRSGETMERCARRLVRELVGTEPAWIEQVGAYADGLRHPGAGALSIGFVAVMPTPKGAGTAHHGPWEGVAGFDLLSPRQRAMAEGALAALRSRMDHAPIAFRLLPLQFTLSELQRTYELLLGKPLHKASFRRALQAALLVAPTDAWRSEGRGRPAQLYEYAPRTRRRGRRGVRLDAIG